MIAPLIPVVRGDLDGAAVYLEASDSANPGERIAVFPTSASAYEAVKAAREVPGILDKYFALGAASS